MSPLAWSLVALVGAQLVLLGLLLLAALARSAKLGDAGLRRAIELERPPPRLRW